MRRLVLPVFVLTFVALPTAPGSLVGRNTPPPDARRWQERAFTAEFAAAASEYYAPLFTGWLHNAVGKNCDAWDEWMIAWLRAHERDKIERVEEAFFYRKLTWRRWYWPSAHVAVRVTLHSGAVFYLDPWRYGPERAVRAQAEYERRWGQPDAVYVD
jgi:hypothetical protein